MYVVNKVFFSLFGFKIVLNKKSKGDILQFFQLLVATYIKKTKIEQPSSCSLNIIPGKRRINKMKLFFDHKLYLSSVNRCGMLYPE